MTTDTKKLDALHRLRLAMDGIDAAYRDRSRAVALAREAGLTRRQVAEATGLSLGHINNILGEDPFVRKSEQAARLTPPNLPGDFLPPWRQQPYTPERIRVLADDLGVEILARSDRDADLARVLPALRLALARVEREAIRPGNVGSLPG